MKKSILMLIAFAGFSMASMAQTNGANTEKAVVKTTEGAQETPVQVSKTTATPSKKKKCSSKKICCSAKSASTASSTKACCRKKHTAVRKSGTATEE